ncbi:unnamed protein product [Linum tenue]|uniref:Uncharacterized protein n=1 Tax=Linum tenue TaxID=586396 RepID=A0AAV0R6X2_9ROSI|nr:unnamed protein product [Linum tenue]CAI0423884.1 unnamed protein product [Linum tenue]CAI0427376.1 unnamed protein product [Linum tenue]CAI0552232.1 unnamed protein product [Linum tenue]
MEKGDTLFQL